jgi:small subunit ribosomal protein S4
MGRYNGAVCRLCRRSGVKLMLKGERCFTPKCAIDRRNRVPGQVSTRFRRLSDRGVQLREKQKARYSYGIMERQFYRTFKQAEKTGGVTGENLLILLERRLDGIVLRLGFADSLAQARQVITHGHLKMNGHNHNIPSTTVKEGDVISWREGSTKTAYFKTLQQTIESKNIPGWLSLNKQTMEGAVVSLPTPNDIESRFEGKTIVEYYSR